MKRLALLCVIGCGHKATGDDRTSGPTAHIESPPGLTACGGSLALLGDWERETSGELVAAGAVAGVERLEHGIRVMLEDKRSFVIGLAPELTPPVAIGDKVDVSISCQPVGRDVIGCMGSVTANGKLVAFNVKPDGWTIERGPRLERSPHANYGATTTYGLNFTVGGAKATSPLNGCVELRTGDGVFRVSGGEVEHADPRAPDSADVFYFSGIRMP